MIFGSPISPDTYFILSKAAVKGTGPRPGSGLSVQVDRMRAKKKMRQHSTCAVSNWNLEKNHNNPWPHPHLEQMHENHSIFSLCVQWKWCDWQLRYPVGWMAFNSVMGSLSKHLGGTACMQDPGWWGQNSHHTH